MRERIRKVIWKQRGEGESNSNEFVNSSHDCNSDEGKENREYPVTGYGKAVVG